MNQYLNKHGTIINPNHRELCAMHHHKHPYTSSGVMTHGSLNGMEPLDLLIGPTSNGRVPLSLTAGDVIFRDTMVGSRR